MSKMMPIAFWQHSWLWPMDYKVLLFRVLLSGTLCHRPCMYQPLSSDSFRVE